MQLPRCTLQALHNAVNHLVLADFLTIFIARWIESLDQLVDQFALSMLSVNGLFVIPALIVVKLETFLAEARLVDHLITPKLISKLHWLVLVEHSAIVLNDVAVST